MDTPLTTDHNHRQFTVISGWHHQWELWHPQMIVGWLQKPMWGVFTGHLVAKILHLVVCSWPHVEPGGVKSGHAGACGVSGGATDVKQQGTPSRTCWTKWEGRPPITPWSTTPHTSLSGLTFTTSRDFTQRPYHRLCVLITWGSTRSFHIISAQAAEYLRCRNSLKSRCEVSDGPAVQLCGWQGWGAEAGVRTRPPTVWGDGTHIPLQGCHKQCRCSIQHFLPRITQRSIQPSLTRVNIVSSNSTRVESGVAWHCLSKRVI